MLALNEPETSLHGQLLAPLSHLIARAVRRSQVFVTTHSRELADSIAQEAGARTIERALVDGEIRIASRSPDEDEDEDEL